MAARFKSPGVYVEESTSGVRTIVGAATSVAAFVGRAARGPVDEPVALASFGDFERVFGGLGIDRPMSHAVRDFFANGGAEAIVVRRHVLPDDGGLGVRTETAGCALLDAGGLPLRAASPGAWANGLRARVDRRAPTGAPDGRRPPPWIGGLLSSDDLFDLTVRDTSTGETETFADLTVEESPRRVDRVLARESRLVRARERPDGSDGVPTPHREPEGGPEGGEDVWALDALSSPVHRDGADGASLTAETHFTGSRDAGTGLYALDGVDAFNLLCIPPDTRDGTTPRGVYATALAYCRERRAMLLVDPPAGWTSAAAARDGLERDLRLTGDAARNAALYFPRIVQADPSRDDRLDTFVPCGAVAGVIARTDRTRGVWQAPAGVDAALLGGRGLSVDVTQDECGELGAIGVNGLRSFPNAGPVVWGCRTLGDADRLGDEYMYVPVKRLALFIEESVSRGTQWAVFEPNDEPLWAQIRLHVEAFLHDLFRQRAFRGTSPREAYFVEVGRETATRNDVDEDIVNIVVGFAPVRPAEFVVLRIRHRRRTERDPRSRPKSSSTERGGDPDRSARPSRRR